MDSEIHPYDYIIVGAGTAGCLLANRLSRNPDVRVLLIEAGGHDDYHWIHIPVGYLYCIGNPRTDWRMQTEPEAGLNGRSLLYPRGKVLGGSSSINGMIYMRGQSRDYDGWAAATGDDTWRWEHCLPYFLRHEDHWRGADEMHAAPGFDAKGQRMGGEWRVERQRVRWDILDAFAQAAQQAGIPATEDFNRGNNFGVGYFEVNQRAGWRWNTSKAFLRPVVSRKNLQVWTGAHVSRLLFEGEGEALRAVGVEVLPLGGDAPLQARATREVVLAAGAVATPQLLQLSGIGPAALLHSHGIVVLRDLPGVGENLQDHLQIRATYAVEGVKTLNTVANSLWGKAGIALEYLVRRSGPMSAAPSQLGAFAHSSAHSSVDSAERGDPSAAAWPNLQYHVQPLSLDAFGEPLHRYNAFTASVCNLNPSSRGHVRIRSSRPHDAPRIQPNYLASAEDRQVASDSLRLTRRIAAMPALAKYRPKEVKPGAQYQSDEELARMAGDIGTTIFHPVGTCRMGAADDDRAVVNSRLQLRGVAGVRVVDASVMPVITSGNTNSPTLMIAERAAEWMLADAGAA